MNEYFPMVSVVIPVYNGAKTMRLCLNAVTQQEYPKDRYEIIVVDNNSKDNTPDIAKEYQVKLVFEREIQGPHAATNTGVRVAAGEILAFTDSDCVPEPDWLRRLVAPFANENVVATGGRIEAYAPKSRVERFLQEMKPLVNNLRLSDSFPVAFLTANCAYRADAFCAAGMFNPNMYTGAEVDLGWRVQLMTKKEAVYVPDAVIYHMFSSKIRTLFRHFRIYGYSEILLGTIYEDVPGFPMTPRYQARTMLRQIGAVFTYLASMVYRTIRAPFRGKDADYVTTPMLWFVVEIGSLCGKLEGLWATRFYRKQFWKERVRVI
jgi:cellulose synthase/poly-beta-1,6-N-acetylglucosamine synthase-like glycosyltransferase